MQKKLAEWEKALTARAEGKVEINAAWLRDFNNVIQWKGRKPGEVLLEEFLDLLGRGGKAKEIRSLCYVIQRALKKGRITEPYKEVAQKVLRILLRAGADGVEKLKAQRRIVNEVRAALGLPGRNGAKQEVTLDGLDEDGFISADAIPDNSHLRYHFEGRYGEIFRAPVRSFWTMIFGREKSGKSTLVLDFAGYLSRRGHRVAWVEAEEDIRGTLRDRVYDQLRINHHNLKFTPKHPLKVDLTGFEFVVINSVSELRLKPDELRSLKEKWPQTNFLFIYHSLKDGDDFRGEATHGNLMDMIVTVRKKDKSVRTEGRYGVGRGEVLFTAEDIAAA